MGVCTPRVSNEAPIGIRTYTRVHAQTHTFAMKRDLKMAEVPITPSRISRSRSVVLLAAIVVCLSVVDRVRVGVRVGLGLYFLWP